MGNWTKVFLGFGMIFLGVIIFGIILDGIGTLLGWTSGGSSIATFTGLEALVAITPVLLWLGLLGAGLWMAFSGVKGVRGSKKGGGGGGGGMH